MKKSLQREKEEEVKEEEKEEEVQCINSFTG